MLTGQRYQDRSQNVIVESRGSFVIVRDFVPSDFQAYEKLQAVRAEHGQTYAHFGHLGCTVQTQECQLLITNVSVKRKVLVAHMGGRDFIPALYRDTAL